MKFICAILLLITTVSLTAQQTDDYISLQDRLKSNIFLKVDADNTVCYVGEPIIVTYKLYTALASQTTITKSPFFNGFDVKDIPGADEEVSRQTVDGVAFDVHTLLKVQLTPQKAGRLQLASIVTQNKIKLIDAGGRKDALLNDVKEPYTLENGYYNLTLSSPSISVQVSPLPNTKQPVNFKGVVGDFKMDVQLDKKLFSPGEPAQLTILITGVGDATKITPPPINWPKEAEIFPTVTDDAATNSDKGGGVFVTFKIPFSIKKPGNYTIPSIPFSYFDAANNQYKTITNIPIAFSVVHEGTPIGSVMDPRHHVGNDHLPMLIGLGILLLFFLFLLIWAGKRSKKHARKKSASTPSVGVPIPEKHTVINTETILGVPAATIHSNTSVFNDNLKSAWMHFFENRFGVSSTSFNRENLITVMTANGIIPDLQTGILNVLHEIDMQLYSNGALETDNLQLYNASKKLMEQIAR